MKKLIAAITLMLYFVVSTGFVVSVHYCMDEINAVELGESTHGECNQCGMDITDGNGCCKDEVKVMKVQVDQLVAKLWNTGFSVPAVPAADPNYLFAPVFTTLEKTAPVAHGPPLSQQDTYLQNCVFRI